MGDKRDKLRTQPGVTPPGITDLMARLANGVQAGTTTALSAIEWLRLTPNAMTIDRDLTETEWYALIEGIEGINRKYQWYLGDCMVYGVKREYGATDEQIQRIMEITGKGKSTLNEYYKTALLFEIHERSYNLEFEQHRVLAVAFSEDTPEHQEARLAWLKVAEDEKLSGRKLSAAIADVQLPASVDGSYSGFPDSSVDDPPAPSDDMEAVELPSDLADKIYRQRFNTVFKKVAENALTLSDLQEVALLRKWCDQVIQGFKPRSR